MNIRFKQIFRQLFRLINRFSLIEKLLYIFLLLATIQAILDLISQLFKDFRNWIYKLLKYITDYIYLNSQIIIFVFISLML